MYVCVYTPPSQTMWDTLPTESVRSVVDHMEPEHVATMWVGSLSDRVAMDRVLQSYMRDPSVSLTYIYRILMGGRSVDEFKGRGVYTWPEYKARLSRELSFLTRVPDPCAALYIMPTISCRRELLGATQPNLSPLRAVPTIHVMSDPEDEEEYIYVGNRAEGYQVESKFFTCWDRRSVSGLRGMCMPLNNARAETIEYVCAAPDIDEDVMITFKHGWGYVDPIYSFSAFKRRCRPFGPTGTVKFYAMEYMLPGLDTDLAVMCVGPNEHSRPDGFDMYAVTKEYLTSRIEDLDGAVSDSMSVSELVQAFNRAKGVDAVPDRFEDVPEHMRGVDEETDEPKLMFAMIPTRETTTRVVVWFAIEHRPPNPRRGIPNALVSTSIRPFLSESFVDTFVSL